MSLEIHSFGSIIDIKNELVTKMKKKLTNEYKDNLVKYYQYVKKNGKKTHLIMPRFAPVIFSKYFKEFRIKNNLKMPVKNDILKWSGVSDDLQNKIVERIFKDYYNPVNLETGMCGLILKLTAGKGKTFIGMRMISELKHNTLIVCHSELILHQWIKELRNYFKTDIGELYAKKKNIKPITVCIVNTIQKETIKIGGKTENMADIFSNFGFIIYDEIHLYKSVKRIEIFNNGIPYSLGLSATPDEDEHKRDLPLQWYAGPIFDTNEGDKSEKSDFKATVKIIKYIGETYKAKFRNVGGDDMLDIHDLYESMYNDQSRNALIIKEAKKLIDQKYNIFIFSHRRKHLEILQNLLQTSCNQTAGLLCDQETTGISALMGGSSASEIDRGEKNQVILSTYQYMSTGKSIPKMNALIIATPFNKFAKQIVGRIFRLGSDTSIERQIIDIVDVNNNYVKGYANKRLNYYKENGFRIVKEK